MSELADELARRMEPEHIKALASEKVTELKEQARERVTEKADELKTQAKEAVMRRTHEVTERADTPKGWSMLGAILGAGVGSLLMRKAFDVRERSSLASGPRGRMYSEYDLEAPPLVPAPDGGLMRPTGDIRGMSSDVGVRTSTDVGVSAGDTHLKERASDVMDMAKDKAAELKDRASGLVDRAMDKTHGLRERIPDRDVITHKATDWYGTVSENPVLLAIGGLAIGALFASLIPVTERERQLIEPAKSKVREQISTLGDQLESKLSGHDEDVSGQDEEFQASASSESENERGTIPPLPPLNDYTSVH
ncbi:hypothetical protein [Archangium sp.]|uniref:hypothetical protein n=1 Tax=Archangium sp. TaxID=1872627 RepID=UPI003899D729